MTFRYLHDCGGINACGPAWDEFGWECVGMTEIEKFPIAVVKHHYQNLIQYGDTTKLKGSDLTARINLLVGGTPCQGFSVAGKRGGLDDPRSGLARNFIRLADECHPRWIIWENVPGTFSSWSDVESHPSPDGKGEIVTQRNDLEAFSHGLEELGYHCFFRVLDAQYFGVPQRRRRIFLVGYFGDWRPAAAVLFDRQSLRGNLAPSFKRKQLEIAGTIAGGTKNSCRDPHRRGAMIFEYHGQDSRVKQVKVLPTINAKAGTGGHNLPLVLNNGRLRTMTPLETERAFGFPDNYTKISWRGKPADECPASLRTMVLGNSIAIPPLHDLGRKIQIVERLLRSSAHA